MIIEIILFFLKSMIYSHNMFEEKFRFGMIE